MDEILDEHLARIKQQEAICKKVSFYTLIFTGVMAIIYLILNLTHWKGGEVFLIIGLIAIALQSLVCFITMKKKTWTAGIRALVTLAATIYIISLFW